MSWATPPSGTVHVFNQPASMDTGTVCDRINFTKTDAAQIQKTEHVPEVQVLVQKHAYHNNNDGHAADVFSIIMV